MSTVKIKIQGEEGTDPSTHFAIIPAGDFNPNTHELFDQKDAPVSETEDGGTAQAMQTDAPATRRKR